MNMSASESATPRFYAEALAASHRDVRASTTQILRSVLASVEVTVDFLTCAVGMFAAYYLEVSLHLGRQTQYPMRAMTAASVVVGLSAVLFLRWNGAYRGGGSLLQIRETERALRAPVQAVLVLAILSLLLDLSIPTTAVLVGLTLIPVLLILQKVIFLWIVRTLHCKGIGIDRAVIYGAGGAGKRIVSALFHSPRLGILPVLAIDDHPAMNVGSILELGYRRLRSVPVQRGPITPELLNACQCNVLILALPNLSSEKQNEAAGAAKQAGMRVAFLSGWEMREQQWAQSFDIDGLSLTPQIEPLTLWHYGIAKRIVDLIVSSLALVFIAPLLALIACLIRLDSPGPAFFIQKRVGRNGELFNIYKFRSMHTNAPKYDFSPTTSCDPRITRIGRFIRRTSLDELPQLINVFLGSMSLVGPRPEMPFIVQDYTSEHRQRLQVIPGITGLWQISADRAFLIHKNIQYDLYYIRNRSFFMDIAILVHTLVFAIRRGI
jgi:exopolysaccharide biosynthesis polyprenyl glycosylphosphotransferase